MNDEKLITESSPAKIDGATYASMVVSAANSIHNQKEAMFINREKAKSGTRKKSVITVRPWSY